MYGRGLFSFRVLAVRRQKNHNSPSLGVIAEEEPRAALPVLQFEYLAADRSAFVLVQVCEALIADMPNQRGHSGSGIAVIRAKSIKKLRDLTVAIRHKRAHRERSAVAD